MGASKIIWEIRDNGGKRSGIERRYFSYSDHIPERRHEKDRRTLEDRRHGLDRRRTDADQFDIVNDQRVGADRRTAWK
jgi:hypothetical protein